MAPWLIKACLAVVALGSLCSASPFKASRPLWNGNEGRLPLRRSISQDPSCPSGYLCEQQACPSGVICPAGETCINFEGTLGCVPTGSSWCALNPTTYEGVGCWNGVCCHGNCYAADAICCDNPGTVCALGKACNVCSPGQACATAETTSCVAGPGITVGPSSSGARPTASTRSTGPVTSSVPTATVVPSYGSFSNSGCFSDSVSARVLVADSLTDQSESGMTVEKCVAFAQQGAWKYAGVEYGGECHVGNTLHNASQTSNGDCNMVCAGSNTELCGAGNRIQVYRDLLWTYPSADLLRAALLLFNSSLSQVLESSNDFIADLQELQSQGQTRKIKARGPNPAFSKMVADGNKFNSARASTSNAASAVRTLAQRASAQDLGEEIPLLDASQSSSALDSAAAAEHIASDITSVIESDLASIADSTTGLINPATDIAAIEGATAAIGLPGIAVAGIGAATGLFLSVLLLLGIKALSPPSQSPTPSTTTAAAPTSTTSCSPTLTPTAMVILLQQNTAAGDYKALVNSLPHGVIDEDSYPQIGYQAILANLDDCEADQLIQESIVATVSLNAVVPDPSFDGGGGGITVQPEAMAAANDSSSALFRRDLSADTTMIFQNPAPFHLRWLSSPWAKRGGDLNGQSYLNTDGFLYNSQPADNVVVYVLDSGIYLDSPEFAGRPQLFAQYNARDRSETVTDGSGHGTHMASCVAGVFSGVWKNAQLAIVKTGDLPTSTTIYDYMKGLAFATNNVRINNLAGQAVFSMSWGFNFENLYWKPLVPRNPINHYDPFPIVFQRYVYPQGIVAVNAASNNPEDDLAAQEPTRSGGADTGLIVVGSADFQGHNGGSTVIDTSQSGILSLYANGVAVCAGWRTYRFDYQCVSGASPATAQIAGLAAYYLSNPAIRQQIMAPGQELVSFTMKQYLRNIGVQLKGPGDGGVPRAAIDQQISCNAPNPPQATMPIYTQPEDWIPTAYLETYPDLKEDEDDILPLLSLALRDAANGLDLVLNTANPVPPLDPMPTCVVI